MLSALQDWLHAVDDKRATWDQKSQEWVRRATNPEDKFTRLLSYVVAMIERHCGAGRQTLDIGCGPGALSEMLAARGFDVYGTDLSQEMIRAAAARLSGSVAEADARFRLCADGEIPFPAAHFDLITAIQLLPYIADQPAYIAQLARLLRPGGVVVATGTNRCSLWVGHEALDRALRLPPHVRTIRNLLLTGYHSGGHVDRRTARQAYCARTFDAMFRAAGFEMIDALDYYHIARLDRKALERSRLGKALARRFAWYHLGVYRKPAA